jgi:hypothetical protein
MQPECLAVSYEYDNNGFADWVARSKLDHGQIFGIGQERTDAMKIYNLVTFGYITDEEGAIPRKLDLTNCKHARPPRHTRLGSDGSALAVRRVPPPQAHEEAGTAAQGSGRRAGAE